MKKVLKVLFSVALAVLALWVIFVAAERTEKGREIISRLRDGINGTEGSYDISAASMFDPDFEIKTDDVGRYCPGTDVKRLDIRVGSCTFETRASENDMFYVEARRAQKFQGYVKEGTLYLKASGGAGSWDKMAGSRIILYIPEGFCFEEAEIEMGAGVMQLSEISVDGVLSLEVGAGQLTAEQLIGEEMNLTVGAGQMELQALQTQRLTAKVGMGELAAAGEVLQSGSVECSMGNLELELAGSEREYNYSVDCVMGSIDLAEESFSGFSNKKTIENGALKQLAVKCVMGNITVRFQKGTAVTDIFQR